MKLTQVAIYLTIFPGFYWLSGMIKDLLNLLLVNPISKEIVLWFLSILISLLIVLPPYYFPVFKNKVFVYLPHNNRDEPQNILKTKRLLFSAIALAIGIILFTVLPLIIRH